MSSSADELPELWCKGPLQGEVQGQDDVQGQGGQQQK
ncbi:hypothetical protein RSAG8_05453, partial [Rhizoctonia solani AG-8 WAC10335]